MSKSGVLVTTLAAGVLMSGALIAGAAAARQASAPVAASRQPVMVGADRGEMTNSGFTLSGRAEVTQGDNRLRADAIQGEGTGGSITRVRASGGVYYVTPNETIRGDSAVYSVTDATIVVTGDVILTQGRNVLTGSRLTYNVDTGGALLEGAPRGASGDRVQGVFYPGGS
jgi:lipopolysaccharide export system protein LptA